MVKLHQAVRFSLIFTHWAFANTLNPYGQSKMGHSLDHQGDNASVDTIQECSTIGHPDTTSPNSTKCKAIMQSVMDTQVKNYSFPGLSVTYQLDKTCIAGTLASGINDGTELTGYEPSRMASMTKTYTASAVLRLWEDGRLGLSDTIHEYLDGNISASLNSAAYDTKSITIEQLLYHTSGIPDSNSDAYKERILGDPKHRWTRQEQVKFIIDNEPKVGSPGEKFSYSDIGYVLLGDIIENVTGLSQVSAFRELLQLSRLGIEHTWFETLEPAPSGLPPRAHQYLGEIDTFELDPSFDLYGGGGLVSTTKDEVLFLRHLFSGKVFRRDETLRTMLAIPETNEESGYAMGIMKNTLGNHTCWGHTGFWGTAFYHCPSEQVTIATDQHQAEFPPDLDILELLRTALRMNKLDCV